MDPELQKRIDAAKAAGYSDEEIQQVLGSGSGQSQQPEATMPGGYNVPILSAEEKARFQQSQQQTEAANTGENIETGLVTAGMGAAAVGVPAALLYGAKAVLSPKVQAGANAIQQGMNLAERGVGAMETQAKTGSLTEQRLQNRPGFGGQQVRPVAPTGTPTYNVPTQNVPQMRAPIPTAPVAPQPMPGMPSAGPVAPTPMPGVPAAAPAPNAPGIMAQLRALAANKILPAAGNIARGSVGPAMAMYSGELNPNEQAELERRRKMGATISR
jgi:hypothetical protein